MYVYIYIMNISLVWIFRREYVGCFWMAEFWDMEGYGMESILKGPEIAQIK